MPTTPKHAQRMRRARAALWLASLAGALGVSHCMEFGGSGGCHPGDCPPGQSCAVGGGCELMEGSCATDADCAEGEFCVAYSGQGFFGPYTDTRCERGPGDVGEPCGASLLEPCVPGASCMYPNYVELSPDPFVGDTGNSYWFEPRVAFNYTTTLGDPICVANGSLGVGEFCSDRVSCAPDLLCHTGYSPKQCRPRSDLGGPCVVSRECAEGSCVLPELEAPYEFGSNNCALADPNCDIREDASCGYWLSCAACVVD